jgi:hypothetical protein
MKLGREIKEFTNNEKIPANRFIWWGSVIIFLLHIGLAINGPNYKGKQKRELTSGFVHDFGKHFFYFFYYEKQFPVASLEEDKVYSKEGAEKLADEKGESLIMEYKHWSRMGENARIFAYLPDAWIKGSAEKPTMKLFNSLVFVAGLLSIFIGLSRLGYPLLAVYIVLIFSFTPFYLFEVYRNKNVFALLASVFLLVIGMNVKFSFKLAKRSLRILLPILTGVIIGFFTEIRGEIKVVLLSAIFLYVLSSMLKWYDKLIMLTLLIAFYGLTQISIRSYFDHKFDKAVVYVEQHGGHVYTGPRMKAHSFLASCVLWIRRF